MVTLALLLNPSKIPLENASDAMTIAKLPIGAHALALVRELHARRWITSLVKLFNQREHPFS